MNNALILKGSKKQVYETLSKALTEARKVFYSPEPKVNAAEVIVHLKELVHLLDALEVDTSLKLVSSEKRESWPQLTLITNSPNNLNPILTPGA